MIPFPTRLRRPLALLGLVVCGGALGAGDTDPVGDAWNDPRNPIRQLWDGRRLDLWSLRPPGPVAPPAHPAGHPVDRFLRGAQEPAGLTAAPPADRRTLARRVAFDLTGLPPSPETVDRFLADPRPDAWERLVDRLLAAPAYGEHQARLWLDVIRYSDSNGFDWDEFRPQAWRFRDYVIRSFNDDKPFDRFIREQLAGDELLAGAPRDPAEQDALLATGYLRLGPHDNAASLFNEQDRSRAELMADLVETTGSAFLGLTLSCCRCHDHKYDPLSQADHFRMRAFFEGVRFADDLPLDLADRQEAIRRHNADIDAARVPIESAREALKAVVVGRVRSARLAELSPEDRAFWERTADGEGEADAERRKALAGRVEPSDADLLAALTEAEQARAKEWEREESELEERRWPFTRGLLMTDGDGEVAPTRVLFQGNHQAPREAVPPGFPSALAPGPAAIAPPPNPRTTGRRLALASWITSPTNPWTARVFVNRIWQQHFGSGLVGTPNDFGLAGARPTHPALLDWLAGEFVSGGWSVKRLHRLILTSETYRQASSGPGVDPSADPGNRHLARQQARRLSAEQLRDALLVAAGTLRRTPGGPPVWPDLPAEILQANPAFLDDNAERTKGWYPSPPELQPVRALYLVQKRTVKVPFLETFDLPDNAVSCARRTGSTVAPHALSLLNSPFAVAAATAFAARIEAAAGSDPDARVGHGFRIALQRDPTPGERAACRRLLDSRPLTDLARVLLNLNEFAYVD